MPFLHSTKSHSKSNNQKESSSNNNNNNKFLRKKNNKLLLLFSLAKATFATTTTAQNSKMKQLLITIMLILKSKLLPKLIQLSGEQSLLALTTLRLTALERRRKLERVKDPKPFSRSLTFWRGGGELLISTPTEDANSREKSLWMNRLSCLVFPESPLMTIWELWLRVANLSLTSKLIKTLTSES